MFVSVIIPAYNVEKYIEECLKSILEQTHATIEIIVCDDASTDNTWNILQKYKDIDIITLLRNDYRRNQAFSRNRCIEMARGDYILLQDADDVSEPQRVEALLAAFEKDIDFVGSGCYCFSDALGKYEQIKGTRRYPIKKDFLYGMPFVHATIMFRADVLREAGGYRATKYTKRCEDYDLLMNMYSLGYHGKNIDDLLYGYRVDIQTIKRRTFYSRICECFARYKGFKKNKMLYPYGWIFIFKPLAAYLYQFVRYRKILLDYLRGKN